MIPFNRPFIVGRELDYIARAVESGQLAGNGEFTRKCCSWMEREFNAKKAILTHSCTGALEMAAILLDLKPGDEVIMPSFTFVSTANSFVLRGAKPVFADIRPDTLNLDEDAIEPLITDRTRAIIPVHYGGVPCEMDAIMSVAEKHGLFVVEDAAQAVQCTYHDSFLGTIGHLGCYSFHETKNFISGEGGALVVNDERFLERAAIIRDKGTNRQRFLDGEIDKYTWVDIGGSFLPSELVAAFLYAQLEESSKISRKRLQLWNRYYEQLSPLEDQGLIRLPVVPGHCAHTAHMFYILLENEELRRDLIQHLARDEVQAVFHYVPLHTAPKAKEAFACGGRLPVTENAAATLLRLPCFYELELSEVDFIVQSIHKFFDARGPSYARHVEETAITADVGRAG